MPLNFNELISRSLPPDIEMPSGLKEDVEYIFSVTYTDPDAMDVSEFSKAAGRAVEREGRDLSTYPPPLGHLGLRQLIADQLSDNRGIDVSEDNVFLSSGAWGALVAR